MVSGVGVTITKGKDLTGFFVESEDKNTCNVIYNYLMDEGFGYFVAIRSKVGLGTVFYQKNI